MPNLPWTFQWSNVISASFLVLLYCNGLRLGIGAFTILDGNKVTGEDAGVNFFLEEASIGSNRGAEAHKYISELNPDVSGHYITQVPPSRELALTIGYQGRAVAGILYQVQYCHCNGIRRDHIPYSIKDIMGS